MDVCIFGNLKIIDMFLVLLSRETPLAGQNMSSKGLSARYKNTNSTYPNTQDHKVYGMLVFVNI